MEIYLKAKKIQKTTLQGKCTATLYIVYIYRFRINKFKMGKIGKNI